MSNKKVPKLNLNYEKDDEHRKPIYSPYEDNDNIGNKETRLKDLDFNLFKEHKNFSLEIDEENTQISFNQEKYKKTLFEKKSGDLVFKGVINDNTDNTKKQRILNFFNVGITDVKEVAKLVGCTIDYVYKVLRENNK